jgi:PAS domain S-box-containing protein
MRDKTLYAIYALFVIMGVIIVGVAVSAIVAINRDADASDWVNQTHAAIYELDGMLSQFQAGEGMMRTFALTSDQRDYTDAQGDYFASLEHLSLAQGLTRDNPDMQSRLAPLEGTIQARVDLLDRVKASVDAGKGEEVRSSLRRDAGAAAVAEFEAAITRMRNRQFELLSERDRESFRRAHNTRLVVGAGVATNLVLFAAVAWLIRDTLATRRKLTETLQQANVVLEQKVQERTAELVAANKSLTRENMQRKWTAISQEHQLRYHQVIVNAVSDLVFVLSKSLNITRLNPSVAHATGLSEDMVLGRSVVELLRLPPDAAGTPGADRLARAVSGGQQLQGPAELIDRSGSARPGVLTVVPLHDNDKVVGAVVVLSLKA